MATELGPNPKGLSMGGLNVLPRLFLWKRFVIAVFTEKLREPHEGLSGLCGPMKS